MKHKLSVAFLITVLSALLSVGCGGSVPAAQNQDFSGASETSVTLQRIPDVSDPSAEQEEESGSGVSSLKQEESSRPEEESSKPPESSRPEEESSKPPESSRPEEESSKPPESSRPEEESSKPPESSRPEEESSRSEESRAAVVPAERIVIGVHSLTLTEGDTYAMTSVIYPSDTTNRIVHWSWTDGSVLSMDEKGVVTAKAPGTAILTASTHNGIQDSCTITVAAKPEPGKNMFSDYQRIVDATTPYTSEGVQRDIRLLCERYPELLRQFSIGTSTMGRDIPCVTIGSGTKKACVVGGIHSREHITISFTMRCLEEFAESYRCGQPYGEYDLQALLQEYTLYMVPMCNPDGTDITNAGEQPLVPVENFDPDDYKLNANGVNLNLNFPYYWDAHYANPEVPPGAEKYPGASAGSEKETQALMKLCEENHFLWLLDMHIVGNGIFWRDSNNGVIPGDSALRDALCQRCDYRYFGMSMDVTVYYGGLENWFRYAFNRPALCIELVPYSQSARSYTYRGYNSYFEDAVNWEMTKFTFPEAMVVGRNF